MRPTNYMDYVPKTIREHPDGWLWGAVWYDVHKGNKMRTIAICGERGAGKSYSMGELANLLDRGKDDVSRFAIERTCYSPTQFSEWVQRDDLPIGTVICLDDAGLALYSKESLTRVAIALGKLFQVIRYKYYIFLLSIPYFKMLESHARKFTDFYIEIVGRDTEKRQNLAKIQALQGEFYSGDIYRHGLSKHQKVDHFKWGMGYNVPLPDFFRFDKPNTKWCHAYEKYKEDYLLWWRKHTHAQLQMFEYKQVQALKQVGKMKFNEALARVRENLSIYLNSHNKIDYGLILTKLVNENNESLVGIGVAQKIANLLNEEKK